MGALCLLDDSFQDTQNSGPCWAELRVPLTHVCVTPEWRLPSSHRGLACQRATPCPRCRPSGLRGTAGSGCSQPSSSPDVSPQIPSRQALAWDGGPEPAGHRCHVDGPGTHASLRRCCGGQHGPRRAPLPTRTPPFPMRGSGRETAPNHRPGPALTGSSSQLCEEPISQETEAQGLTWAAGRLGLESRLG